MRVFCSLLVATLIACGGGSSDGSSSSKAGVTDGAGDGQHLFPDGETTPGRIQDNGIHQDAPRTGRPVLQRAAADIEVEILTEDDIRIWGRFLTPGGLSPYPAVLVVHQYGMDHSQWMPWVGELEVPATPEADATQTAGQSDAENSPDGGAGDSVDEVTSSPDPDSDVVETEDSSSPDEGGPSGPEVETLLSRGFAVLVIDLRGHGASDPYTQGFHLQVDSAGAPLDIQASVGWLKKQQTVDPARITIMGASIGANLVYLAMAQRLVNAGVAISARSQNVAPLMGLGNLDGVDFGSVFCVAGELDGSGAQKNTCNILAAVTEAPNPVIIQESSPDHGVVLLANYPEVWLEILSFLEGASARP